VGIYSLFDIFYGRIAEVSQKGDKDIGSGAREFIPNPKAEAQKPRELACPQILLKTFGKEWKILRRMRGEKLGIAHDFLFFPDSVNPNSESGLV
jgi:hypothetical protein